MGNIPGFATLEGTGKYTEKMSFQCAKGHFRLVHNLWASSIGIGTYLGKPDSATDRLVENAIVRSVQSGVNVIDTAINYRREHGEKSVGKALRKLLEEGVIDRAEIVLCTKGGFIPGTLGINGFKKSYVDDPHRGIMMNDLVADCHCMHPEYLEDQLDRSLNNLGVETIDVYHIHNPETQLGPVPREIFESRLLSAFKMLEKAVEKGKIRFYGLATWSAFRVTPSNARHISLEHVKRLAGQAAAGKDHLGFIQLPLNLRMPEAVLVSNQDVKGKKETALEASLKLGIHPFISGSIAQGDIPGLSEKLRGFLGARLANDFQRALQFTRSAPGIVSALTGMKRLEHVDENLRLCSVSPLESSEFLKLAVEKLIPI